MRRIVAAVVIVAVALTPPTRAQSPTTSTASSGVRELRLGVVCYGGLSLAVYMFGTTRELHHLLLASQALERDAGESPDVKNAKSPGMQGKALPASALPYYEVLREKWRREGVRTRVVIDIISGTSAGGINGIILGKAIATGAQIADLRSLWFKEADIRRLAGHRPWPLWALGRVLLKRPALLGDSWLRQLYEAFQAMDRTATTHQSSLLPEGGRLDVLVTSTDYYGSRRVVEIGDPTTSSDLHHDHVFRFAFPDAGNRGPAFAGTMGNAALAFAARSSASFPVAFPPTNLAQTVSVLPVDPEHPLDAATLARQLYGHQLADSGRCGDQGSGASTGTAECAQELATEMFLIDGGALDNKPLAIAFRLAARTIPTVPAQRVFLYLEPDPQPEPAGAPALHGTGPNSWQALVATAVKIRSAEPIGTDLLELAHHNERVDRLLDVVAYNEWIARQERDRSGNWTPPEDPSEKSVATLVEEVVDYKLDVEAPRYVPLPADKGTSAIQPAPLTQQAVTSQRLALEHAAAIAQPLANDAYLRLRVQSVLAQLAHDLATAVCSLPEDYEGPRASLAREIVHQWAEGEKLKSAPRVNDEQVDTQRRDSFLAAWDLGYLRRNLRFVLAWIDGQYPGGATAVDVADKVDGGTAGYDLTPQQLELAHSSITLGIQELSATLRADTLRRLVTDNELEHLSATVCVSADSKRSTKEQAADIVRRRRDQINAFIGHLEPKLVDIQDGIRARLFSAFIQQTREWARPDARRAVLARYLGFPFWDRVTYPYTAFSGTGELAHAAVVRLSPRDAKSLSNNGPARLIGSTKGHFGAFISHADGRQSDYVWGRLDGADRLTRLLDPDTPPDALFRAIVDEEKPAIDVAVWKDLDNCLSHRGTAACDGAAKH